MGYVGTIKAAGYDLPEIEAVRCYAAALSRNEPVLPNLVELVARRGLGASAAVALASVFQLTEACLGRRLVTKRADARAFSADEEAMLLLFATAGDISSHAGSAAVPHGLPGALVWAIRSARRLCRAKPWTPPPMLSPTCPFQP